MSLRRLVLALPFLAACASAPSESGPVPLLESLPRPLTGAETKVGTAGNQFTLDLFREATRALPPDSNSFLSPLSASFALGMTLNGARAETFDAMRDALRFAGSTQGEINDGYRGLIDLLLHLDNTTEMRVGNAIFTRQGFAVEPAFLSAGRTSFDAEIQALDFASPAAVETINGWVNGKTNGRIPKLITSIASSEVLFLVNAIYFKGRWRTTFDPAVTQAAPFRCADGVTRSVQMMSRPDATVRGATLPNATAIELGYGNGAFVMDVILPNQGTTPAAVLAGLDAAAWTAFTGSLVERKLDLRLPRFKIESTRMLEADLDKLGMGIAFDAGRADFSGIANVAPERLYLTRVVQKAFVEVNEEGTEAAAATGVGVGVTSLPPSFVVDRPFLFVIRERFSGTILFIGQVNTLG